MHIPDGLLEPEVCALTGLASAAAVGYSLKRVNQLADEKIVPLTGVTAAMIFAAQMVNFPLALFALPVSGHLMGGVLAAILLGPWAGCLAITMVLVVQCLFFSDGGLLSLGANVLHMAVIGCWGGYACFEFVKRFFKQAWTGTVIGAAVASWFAVVVPAVLFSFELHWSLGAEGLHLGRFLALMFSLHAVIGIGEAIITLMVLKGVMKQRPEFLTRSLQGHTTYSKRRFVTAGLAFTVAVIMLLAPWASSSPDGLEAALQQSAVEEPEAPAFNLLLSDYEIPWLAEHSVPLSVSLAGVFGLVGVFILTWLLGRMLRLRPSIIGVNGE